MYFITRSNLAVFRPAVPEMLHVMFNKFFKANSVQKQKAENKLVEKHSSVEKIVCLKRFCVKQNW